MFEIVMVIDDFLIQLVKYWIHTNETGRRENRIQQRIWSL